MKLARGSLFAAGILAVVVVLTGCTAASQDSNATKSSPSATPSPTPTEMSTAQAGQKHLEAVCPVNVIAVPFEAAYQDGNLQQMKTIAAKARDDSRTAGISLTDPAAMWPTSLQGDLKLISDSEFAYAAVFDAVVNSTTIADARAAAVFPDNGSAASAQRVRAMLNINADTTASCKNIT